MIDKKFDSEIEKCYVYFKYYFEAKIEAIQNNDRKSIELYQEEYEKNFNEFVELLKGLIGFVFRKYVCGFRQKTELYLDIRKNIILWILNQLNRGHYEQVKHKIKKSKKPFESYLFLQIRGELTKFFNKFNRERLQSNYDYCINEVHDDSVLMTYNNIVTIVLKICKEYDINMDIGDIMICLMHNDYKKIKDVKFTDKEIRQNVLNIMLISWELSKKYFDKITY